MMPIGDDNTGRKITPFVNYILIALNILVFVLAQGMGSNEAFTLGYSTVPAEILQGRDLTGGPANLMPTPIPVYATMLTSMFMHGSIAHIVGNMLYLWIFGDNLENVMGHVKYLIFYILCGLMASAAHVMLSNATGNGLMIPSLGASGAISGVLGGYLILFPKNKVRVIAMRSIMEVPAIVTLGIWILLQVISGVGSLGNTGGGVAYAAHVGGFVAGLVLAKFFANRVPKEEGMAA